MKYCFVHVNNAKVRQSIIDNGIRLAHLADSPNRNYGLLFNGKLVIGTPFDLEMMTIEDYIKQHHICDCGTDVEQFIHVVKKIQEENKALASDKNLVNNLVLKQYENKNIFEIFKKDGVQMIKLLAYFYQGEDHWEHVEFSGLEMPLQEWLKADLADKELWESEVKQYYTDMTEEEAEKIFLSYNAKPISIKEINENTPEGIYI